jgi:predicted Zn-dependent protease
VAVLDNGKSGIASQMLDTGAFDGADVNQHQAAVVRGLRSWIAADWELAYRLFRDELQLHPGNVILRHAAIRCALRANRPAAAIDMYESMEYDTAVPAAVYVLTTADAAHAHHLMGQHVEELRVLESLRTDLPSSVLTDWGLMRHAVALGALGDADRIDALLDRNSRELGPCASTQARVGAARELRTHGHTEAATAVIQPLLAGLTPGTEKPVDAGCPWWNEAAAEALLIAGRDHEAAELCRGFSIDVEGWRAAVMFPGIAAARLGEPEIARLRAADLAALGRAELTDGTGRPAKFTLGRAIIYAQLGDEDRAMELVRQAVTEGLPVHDLHGNIFLEPLWNDPGFQEIVRPKG